MNKAPSIVVDEQTARRLKFVSLIAGNVGVISQEIVDRFVTNEGREEIAARLLRGFSDASVMVSETSAKEVSPSRPRIEILRETPKPCVERSTDEQVAGMEAMFRSLKWSFTTSGLIIPKRQKDYDRLLVIGDTTLTNNRVYDACDASFNCWRYSNDLDAAVPAEKDERHPSRGIYAIWVRDVAEADEELINLSAIQISKKESKLKTVTLLERELLELVYLMETGNHLDLRNWTLCSGSRLSVGGVPSASCYGGRFWVNWYDPDDRFPNLRARQAVTL